MGRRNKVVKLTSKKEGYINRAKIRNDSNRNIARDMKISVSTVKRVWAYWLKYHDPLPIKKLGRKKKVIDEGFEKLILEVYKEHLHVVYIPSYSPELDPIEQSWRAAKKWL